MLLLVHATHLGNLATKLKPWAGALYPPELKELEELAKGENNALLRLEIRSYT